jgi:hypothetical protein
MTFITSACFFVCAGLELLVSGETQRRGAWKARARCSGAAATAQPGAERGGAAQDYYSLAALTLAGMYLTNW